MRRTLSTLEAETKAIKKINDNVSCSLVDTKRRLSVMMKRAQKTNLPCGPVPMSWCRIAATRRRRRLQPMYSWNSQLPADSVVELLRTRNGDWECLQPLPSTGRLLNTVAVRRATTANSISRRLHELFYAPRPHSVAMPYVVFTDTAVARHPFVIRPSEKWPSLRIALGYMSVSQSICRSVHDSS